ncbi:DUF4326 domain-containing protein [Mycolicibacterium arenosum]|uniref:DUF4326 domain-containing protein n=1 Tax=Mycolicibacterium arenosum TaxID=2952157 RepID=A0ABT1MCE2_9MYCO|nr:DUF4326 domain-containing protein [Mycolicibacterium sp. CAU 1645]MCP9276833.1 DUF4326 domain-containing protein [Mycolicibacterium sp. CAU 1645]
MTTPALPRSARWAPVEPTDLDARPRLQIRGEDTPRGAVNVTAGTPYANPFEAIDCTPEQRAAALVRFAVWLPHRAELREHSRVLAGRDLACTCALDDPGCHRDVWLDVANPPVAPDGPGRAMGLTVRRPWASMLLTPAAHGGKTVENRSWSTDYRGPLLVFAGTRVDDVGIEAARRAGLDADWHVKQRGWLGAAVLVDVHPARHGCCRPWGRPRTGRGVPVHHWVFADPHRLAHQTFGRGFTGLRPVSWSVLVGRTTRVADARGEHRA